MTIKYKATKMAQPGIKGGGQYKYYPRVCERRKMDLNSLAERISMKSTLTRADVHATLVALVDEIPDLLLDNYSVQLGELGIFSAHINGESANTAEELTYRNIKNLKVVFRPGISIKQGVKNARFTKVD